MNFFDKIKKKEIILGSTSKRRKELLKEMGLSFKAVKSGFREKNPEHFKSIKSIPIFLAKKKADKLKYLIKEKTILITADTIVVHKGVILGKPKDKLEALSSINLLSGNSHKVITGVCIKSLEKEISYCEETMVCFKSLSQEEIIYYIEKYQPYDKAGSYGVQEWIGLVGVKNINGSYSNVVGLPSASLIERLKDFI